MTGKGNHIGIITLNRPDALNAMNTETVNEFRVLLEEIKADEQVRCLILTGEGRAFCTGGDINEESKTTVLTGYQFSCNCYEVLAAIEHFRAPVIAAINGYALGGGMEFALACDIRIVSSKASMGFPEISLAVIPGWGGTQRLPRLITPSKARQLMFTGEKISADEAYRIGLVDEISEPETLMADALAMAEKIAEGGPLAMKYLKTAIAHGLQCDLERGLQIEAALFAQLYGTEDQVEAMKAFLEKRPHKPFVGR
jgi:enoyl-CoA hydratase